MTLYAAFGGKGKGKTSVKKPFVSTKGKGKGKKGKAVKKVLTGPNGESADDETCWDVKETGLCPRYPCKWAPCVDLPEDDPIFSEAKKRPEKGAKKGTKGKGKGKFVKTF